MSDRILHLTFAHDEYAEPELADLLARFDEGLRHGTAAPTPANSGLETPAPPLQDCLRALEGLWPRSAAKEYAAPADRRIGKFRIESTLGQGGFGIVYLARDESLNRRVALKVPQLHAALSDYLLERFRREGRAAAALDHPHIIPVHEAGTADGVCYIASAYCPGPNLAQWLKEHPGGVGATLAARIVAQLADAVAYSHAHKVLHRDIKPGNVMLVPREAPNGEELPFTPRLGDFGLAKLAEDAGAHNPATTEAVTGHSLLMGTPAYMSPEQAAGNLAAITPATDVYSLGVVLYELLTGRPPFQGPRHVDVLQLVREAEPVGIRQLRPDVPRDLETICLKSLEKTPLRRYATAANLRDDLDRYLRGDPISARPPGRFAVGIRWVRRHRTLTAISAAIVLAVFGITAQQWRHNAAIASVNADLKQTVNDLQKSNAERTQALSQSQRNEEQAHDTIYALDIRNAWRAYAEHDLREFTQIVNRYRDGQPLAKYRGLEWGYLEQLTHCEGRELLKVPTSLYAIDVAPDDHHCAVAGQDAVVRIVDVRSGQIVAQWPTGQREVNDVTYSTAGDILWTTGDDGTIRTWDVATRTERMPRIQAHPGHHVFDVLFDSKRNLLLSCADEPVIRLWDATTGESRGTLEQHTETVQCLAWHPDRDHVLSASRDRTARLWNIETRQDVAEVLEPSRLLHCAVSPNGKFAVIAGMNRVLFWNLYNGQKFFAFEILDRCDRIAFGSSETFLYALMTDGSIRTHEIDLDPEGRPSGSREVGAWQAHDGRAFCVCPSGDGTTILTAGAEGTLKRWKAHFRGDRRVVSIQAEFPSYLAFHPSIPQLAVKNGESIDVYQYESSTDLTQSNGFVKTAQLNDGACTSVCYSPSGEYLAATFPKQYFKIWRTNGFIRVAEIPSGGGSRLTFTHDSSRLVFARDELVGIEFASPESGRAYGVSPVPFAFAPTCSPAAPLIVAVENGTTPKLYNWQTGKLVWEKAALPADVNKFAFSPDGRWIAAGGGDRIVYVIDVRDGSIVRKMTGHRNAIVDLSFSPDGRTIASKSDDWTMCLWHFSTGQLLLEHVFPNAKGAPGNSVAFSPDGRWLASSDSKYSLRLLPLR